MQAAITRSIISGRRTIIMRSYTQMKSLLPCGSPAPRLLCLAKSQNKFSSPFHNSYCSAGASMNAEEVAELMKDPKRHHDYETFLKLKKDKAVITVDVRQPEELVATGQIPDSINVPLDELDNALGKMSEKEFQAKYNAPKPSKESRLVFSCQAGRRSLIALSIALTHEYINSAHYRGGWADWAQQSTQAGQQ